VGANLIKDGGAKKSSPQSKKKDEICALKQGEGEGKKYPYEVTF